MSILVENEKPPTKAQETANHSHRAYCPPTGKPEWFRNRTVFRTFLWYLSRPDVLHIKPNPCRIERRFGNQHQFDFDFRLKFADGRTKLTVVRRSIDLISSQQLGPIPEDWETVLQLCAYEGAVCEFTTEDTIAPFSSRIDHMARLLPYVQQATQEPDAELSEQILAYVERHKTLSYDELARAFPEALPQAVIAQTAMCVYRGTLETPFDGQPWSTSTIVSHGEIPASAVKPVAEHRPTPIAASSEATDPTTWPVMPAESIEDDKKRKAYQRNHSIVWARLVEGKTLAEVARSFECSKEWVRKLVNRCQAVDESGELMGWRGAVPYLRPASQGTAIRKPSKPAEDDFEKQKWGLTRLFRRFPDIKALVIETALPRKAKDKRQAVSGRRRVSRKKVWKTFKKACKAKSIPPNEWPFNTADKGREAIRRFIKTLGTTHTERYLETNLGDRANVVWSATQPNHDIRPELRPFAYIQIDGHDSNAYSAITIEDMSGMPAVLPLGRFWLIPSICVGSKAVLGYTITPTLNYRSIDLLDTICNGLTPWERYPGVMPDKSYRQGAGLPSGLFPFCAWRGVDMVRLDNALAHLSRETQERMVETIGAVIVSSLPDHKTSNAVVERFFRSFDEVFAAGPTSTGSNPNDPRREDPVEAAINHQVELFLLEGLADCVLANYNASPHSALNGLSPLQYIQQWHQRHPNEARFITEKTRESFPLYLRTFERVIRRNEKGGGACYVEWMYSSHTNDRIAGDPSLNGEKVLVTVDSRDARIVHVYRTSGEPLGQVVPQDRWNERPHTLRERRIIGAFRRANLIDLDSTDPIADFQEVLEQRALLTSTARRELAVRRDPIARTKGDQASTSTNPDAELPPREWVPITGNHY